MLTRPRHFLAKTDDGGLSQFVAARCEAATAHPIKKVLSKITGEVGPTGEIAKSQEVIEGDPAMDNLEIRTIPVIRKEFTDDPVAPGGIVTLEFTITNPSTEEAATDINFMDVLGDVLPGLVAIELLGCQLGKHRVGEATQHEVDLLGAAVAALIAQPLAPNFDRFAHDCLQSRRTWTSHYR